MKWIVSILVLAYLPSMSQSLPSKLTSYAFRLTPHQDVKKSIMDFAARHKIKAGCILTAVGSLEQMNLRFANAEHGTMRKEFFEVVSLTGTFSDSSAHLHISLSDAKGQNVGGHLLDENLVYTTLELVIVDLNDLAFEREKDPAYGYLELLIKPRTKNPK